MVYQAPMNIFVLLFVMGCHSFKLKQFNSNLLLLSVLFVNNMSKSVTSGLVSDSDTLRTSNNLDYKFYDVKEKREMKRAIMQGLGLKNSIDIKKVNVSQDEYARMYNVYLRYKRDRMSNLTTDLPSTPRLQVIKQKEGEMDETRSAHGTLVFNFDGESFDRSSVVDHSSLRMLLPPVRDELITRIQIHQVIDDGRGKKKYLIDSKNVYLSDRDAKWCEFDVTTAVERWMKFEGRNGGSLRLELHCPKCNQRRYDLRPVEPAVINIINSNSLREKRSLHTGLEYRKDRRTDCKVGGKKCCRQEMNFDLEKLGFSYIINPKRYDAGICKGRCPPNYNAAHNHAVLQGMLWKKNKTATPRVCCAPSKLTHLEVLIVDEEDPTKLIVRDLPNMIVLECACS